MPDNNGQPPPPRPLSAWAKAQTIGAATPEPPLAFLAPYFEGAMDLFRGATGLGDQGPAGPTWTNAGALLAALPVGSFKSLRALTGEGFYSRVEDALKLVPANGAHPNKVLSILKSNASAEELALRQVPEFLAAQGNAAVTPEALAAHLAAHPAPFPAVKTLGGAEMWSPELKSALQGVQPGTQEGWVNASERLERIAQRWQGNGDPAQAHRYFTLSEEARSIAEGVNPSTGSTGGMPKYGQYQLPGGTDYRETLITLPTPASEEARRMIPPSQAALNQTFRSAHFDEPNILVHTRSNTRTLPTGEQGRFLEEVQSDWHQKGKAQGYRES